MSSTPSDDSDPTEQDDRRTDDGSSRSESDSDEDNAEPTASVETISDLVTAVKLVVGGVALFVTALFGGSLGHGGGQVAVLLLVGGAALLALGYWSLPDVS